MYFSKFSITTALISLSLISGTGVLSSRPVLAQQPPAITFPAVAAGCVAINEVTTGQATIRKQIVMGNENTDFAVPTGQAFQSFNVEMIPENTASYTVTVNFKYNDGTASKIFSKKVDMTRLKLYSLEARSPIAKQPYQINIVVDGPRKNVYNIAIQGCAQ